MPIDLVQFPVEPQGSQAARQPSLLIHEIFYSIQGESTHAGLPCVFVRLRGCHLRCNYCDTTYAFHEGARQSLDEIIATGEQLSGGACGLWEITGGEPLLQKNVHALMARLCDMGKTVLLETSGACDIAPCDPRVIRIMDLKTPGSGEADKNILANIPLLTKRDEVKFVLTSREDYDWMKRMLAEHRLAERVGSVLVSAVFNAKADAHVKGCAGLHPRVVAEWILADKLPVRFQTQLHKIIWEPSTRGV